MKNFPFQENFPAAEAGFCRYQLETHTTADFRIAVAGYDGDRRALLAELEAVRGATAYVSADDEATNLARTLERSRQAADMNCRLGLGRADCTTFVLASTTEQIWQDKYDQNGQRTYTGVGTALERLFTDTTNWVDPATGDLREPRRSQPRPVLAERIGNHAMNLVGAIDDRVTKLANRVLRRWI